jgi:hypothetical protein
MHRRSVSKPRGTPRCDAKIHLQDAPTRLFDTAIAVAESNPHPLRHISDYVSSLQTNSTPIALPRPPQTRAASFKRLYPK